MKHTIIASVLGLTAITAQAETVTLSCTYNVGDKGTKTSILEFNTLTLQGNLDGHRASLGNFGDTYSVDTNNFGFELNRQTLAIPRGISLIGNLFLADDVVGQCEKIQSPNQI